MPQQIYQCQGCRKWQVLPETGEVLTCPGCRNPNPRRLLSAFKAIRDGVLCPHCGAGLPPLSTLTECPACGKVVTAAGQAAQVDLPQEYGTVVRSYEQRALLDAIPDQRDALKVQAGMCHGACLDWIRRVLQGGSAGYGKAKPEYLAGKAAVFENLRKQFDDWDELAPNLDSHHRKVHQAEHGKQTKRPFSGIQLAMTLPRQRASDLDQVVGALLEQGFASGGCAIFGVATGPGETGHAVAIERRNTGGFHLFDPNIGIYDIKSTDRLKGAIRWLFETKYGMTAATRECNFEVFKAAG